MIRNLAFVLFAAAFLGACNNPPADNKAAAAAQPANMQFFGDTIKADGAVGLGDMLAKMGQSDSLDAKVTGTVAAVCQAKGCWMQVATDGVKDTMMVKFKDYGFFVPKDIAGKKVVVQGYAYTEVTPVDELKHMAEDEGLPKAEIDAIKEPKKELKFMASGVIVMDK